MTWDSVLKIVFTGIASIGGAGAIIWAVVKFSANRIADRLSKKYEYVLNEKLESYKAELDKKNYITQVCFDKEFHAYSALIEATNEMVLKCFWLFPTCLDRIPVDEDEHLEMAKNRYKDAAEAHIKYNSLLMGSLPFLNKEISDSFQKLRELCGKQLSMYTYCGELAPKRDVFVKSVETAKDLCWDRTDKIIKKQEELSEQLRIYLSSLAEKRNTSDDK